MIPKKIHYCWFGGNPLPEMAKICIASWKRYCPDFEIIEWNENNFNVDCCDYVREAYAARKWAFVSDYARFKILYENGGVYFDTDVELLKPIHDILERGAFMGCETDYVSCTSEITVNPGLGIATVAGNDIYKEIIDGYHSRHFLFDDGSYDMTTVVDYTTGILFSHGLQNKKDIQLIANIYIYSKEYFCPKDYQTGVLNITANTYSVHHFDASWVPERDKYYLEMRQKYEKILPRKLANICAMVKSSVKYDGMSLAIKKILGRLFSNGKSK